MRSGARFACTGDGLCCADAHLLGPVSPREARAINEVRPGAIVRDAGLVVIRTQEDGTCTFQDRAGRCGIHAHPLRPRTCHRYPFLLVSTPDGGRIGTDHRCPCRSMGPRPALRAADVEDALRDGAGRLSVDRRVDAPIPIERGRTMAWAAWREVEGELLEALLERGVAPERVLDAAPFPPMTDATWEHIGHDLAEDDRPMRWARANQWAGDAILALHGERIGDRPRPWSDAFDRAERRASEAGDPDAMIADWIADSIWSLEWCFRGTWALARADLATRLAMARWIAARLEAEGTRADRATAEGIAVAEIVGLSEPWEAVLARVEP